MDDIQIFQGRTPQLPPADARVVIDVIRAFTTAHVALRKGASEILLAEHVEQARRLAAEDRSRLLAGERNAVAPPGFDAGNSPQQMDGLDVEGRQVVLTTTNGVKATVHALGEAPVYVTGFSNAGATVGHLRELVDHGARRIQLIASHPEGDEDLACAEWIDARLSGAKEPTDQQVIRRIRDCRAAEKFSDPDRPQYRAGDIDYCARREDTPWAMAVDVRDTVAAVRRRCLDDTAGG